MKIKTRDIGQSIYMSKPLCYKDGRIATQNTAETVVKTFYFHHLNYFFFLISFMTSKNLHDFARVSCIIGSSFWLLMFYGWDQSDKKWRIYFLTFQLFNLIPLGLLVLFMVPESVIFQSLFHFSSRSDLSFYALTQQVQKHFVELIQFFVLAYSN